eukprot:758320-Hanusia_phi.AAC.1
MRPKCQACPVAMFSLIRGIIPLTRWDLVQTCWTLLTRVAAGCCGLSMGWSSSYHPCRSSTGIPGTSVMCIASWHKCFQGSCIHPCVARPGQGARGEELAGISRCSTSSSQVQASQTIVTIQNQRVEIGIEIVSTLCVHQESYSDLKDGMGGLRSHRGATDQPEEAVSSRRKLCLTLPARWNH